MASSVAFAQHSVPLADEARILPSSLDLERRVEPWCPGDCAVAVPFVATYHRNGESLVFVGVRHAFQPNDPTMRAVADGFASIQPRVVILEGFPTVMGESPAPIVAAAQLYGTADADEFARGEGVYAASIALGRGIPFVGGEPTRGDELHALKAKGYTDTEIAFSAMVGAYSQAFRSKDMPDMSLKSLLAYYPQAAEAVTLPWNRGGWNLPALPFADLQQQYRGLYGVDIIGDVGLPDRIDVVNDRTRHGQQSRVGGMVRDRHLLGLIEQQLAERKAVLVVYGGSHWATLSAALQERLGKPQVKPFID